MTLTPWLTALVLSTFQPNGLPQHAIVRLGVSPLRLGPVQIAISADNQRIRTVTQEGFVRIFDAKSGELLASRNLMTRREDNNNYYGGNQGFAGMSADGSRVLIQDSSDYSSRGVRVYDIETGKSLVKYPQTPGNDWIAGSAISPDGKTLIINEYGNGNPRYTVVEVATGTSRQLFEPVNNAGVIISSGMIHFSTDSTKVILLDANGGVGPGGMKGTCYVVADGKKLWNEPVGSYPRFTPDSKHVLTTGTGKEAKILNATTGKAVEGKEVTMKQPAPKEVAMSITVGDKGEYLYPLKKGGAMLWNLAKGEPIATLPTGVFSQGVREAAFSHDGTFLITAFHGNLCRWNLPQGNRVYGEPSPPGSATSVSRVIFSPDNKKLFSLGEGDSHGIWDVEKKSWTPTPPTPPPSDNPNVQQAIFFGGYSMPRSVSYTAAGPRFLSSGYAVMPEVFDGTTGKSLAKLTENKKNPGGAQAFEYGNGLLTSDGLSVLVSRMNYNGNESRITIEKWDVATRSRQHKIELSAGNYTPYASMSLCGRFAFLGSKVIALNSGAILFGVNKSEQQQYYYYGGTSHFSPDGRVLATTINENQRDYGQQMNELNLWDITSGTLIRKVSWRVNGSAFSPDGRLIAIANTKGVKVFDLRTGKEILLVRATEMKLHMYYDGTNGTTALTFSPDNSMLATGHVDGTVTIWKVPVIEKSEEVKADTFDKFWDDLATQEPLMTRTQAQRLIDHPESAIRFLQAKFTAPPLPPLDVDPNVLVRKLDSPAFSDRHAAYKKLKEYGPRITAILEDNLQKTDSVEVRSKLEQLLQSQNIAPQVHAKGASLRAMRMFEVLEHLASPEAKQILQGWSEHTSNPRMMAEAKQSLSRIANQGK